MVSSEQINFNISFLGLSKTCLKIAWGATRLYRQRQTSSNLGGGYCCSECAWVPKTKLTLSTIVLLLRNSVFSFQTLSGLSFWPRKRLFALTSFLDKLECSRCRQSTRLSERGERRAFLLTEKKAVCSNLVPGRARVLSMLPIDSPLRAVSS
jgi:hypothetical protein